MFLFLFLSTIDVNLQTSRVKKDKKAKHLSPKLIESFELHLIKQRKQNHKTTNTFIYSEYTERKRKRWLFCCYSTANEIKERKE